MRDGQDSCALPKVALVLYRDRHKEVFNRTVYAQHPCHMA